MNEHIHQYCKEFIESPENPHFAIFIKGKWGSGKTYFINNLIESYPKKDDKKLNTENQKKLSISQEQIMKISLFGVEKSDDIDARIYQALHPILSSKGAQLTGAILKSALKLGTNFDFNKDGNTDLSISLDDLMPMDKDTKTRKIKKHLLIVDDFERAEMSPSAIFGYFSQIISDSDTRVIFIGNEERIQGAETKQEKDEEKLDKDAKEKTDNSNYFLIKEKTIGIEFLIEPDKNAAIKSFLDEIKFDKDDVDFIGEKILEVVESIKCDNLRTVRQCLYNLKMFLSNFSVLNDKSERENIIFCFIVLFLQKSLNLITDKDNPVQIVKIYERYHQSLPEYEKENPDYNDNLTKLSMFLFSHIPLMNCWQNIIFNGNYDSDYLNTAYTSEKEAKELNGKKENALFKLIGNWRILEKKEFKNLIKIVQEEFSTGKYLHPGLILHYANIFIIFSKWGLIPDTIDEIKNQVNNFINKFKKQITPLQDWFMINTGYGGYGYSWDIQEVVDIREQLKLINFEIRTNHLTKTINEEVKKLPQNLDNLKKDIMHSGNNKYYGEPILSLLKISAFYSKLKSLSISEQSTLITAFEERYGLAYSNHPFTKEYSSDYDNLLKLYRLYKSDEKECLYNPQELLRQEITKRLLALINYFEEYLGKEKTNEM